MDRYSIQAAAVWTTCLFQACAFAQNTYGCLICKGFRNLISRECIKLWNSIACCRPFDAMDIVNYWLLEAKRKQNRNNTWLWFEKRIATKQPDNVCGVCLKIIYFRLGCILCVFASSWKKICWSWVGLGRTGPDWPSGAGLGWVGSTEHKQFTMCMTEASFRTQ